MVACFGDDVKGCLQPLRGEGLGCACATLDTNEATPFLVLMDTRESNSVSRRRNEEAEARMRGEEDFEKWRRGK